MIVPGRAPALRRVSRVLRRGAAAAAAMLVLATPPATAVPSPDDADEALIEDADYAAGRQALREGDFAAALPRLQAALRRFPDSANLHNDLGYVHRNLRQIGKAFEHYQRALAIDPRHRSAHEYIGEAYLVAGDLVGAERHLEALRTICLLPCDELEDLRKAIVEHRAQVRSR